jgi:hypothetical protein
VLVERGREVGRDQDGDEPPPRGAPKRRYHGKKK